MSRYFPVRGNLQPEEIASIKGRIEKSDEFELDDLSHVVVKSTNSIVGYIGEETAELFFDNKKLTDGDTLYLRRMGRLLNLLYD